ncbi:MAG TPA: aminoacyl-tRNA hydrolase [Polyangiaceae bacterium]|nr:aminoacyl-tRNA hydrolase [Polyangiaceae bacterium]
MWLVVGLGNPGKEYASHRHNVGFMAVDEIARAARGDSFKEKFSAEYARVSHAGEDAILLKPQTFMNLSGQSVQPAAAFFKVPVERILVLHDELDLPFGDVKLKVGGGHAGHNGLRSMIERLGSPGFARVRIGIGRPPAGFRGEVADYVLSSFDTSERAELTDILARAVKATLDVMDRGLTAATNSLHAGEKKLPSDLRSAKKQKPSGAAASAEAPKKQATTATDPRSGAESAGASPRGKA